MTRPKQHWGELRAQVALLSILVSGETDLPPISDPDCDSLTAAIDLIHAEYSRPLSVQEMAQRAGMCRFRPDLPRGPSDLCDRACPRDHWEPCRLDQSRTDAPPLQACLRSAPTSFRGAVCSAEASELKRVSIASAYP